MRSVLHAEWTKLRTVAGPWWLLLGAVVVTVAVGVAATSIVPFGSGDPTRLSLTGVVLGQALLVVLSVLIVGDEYSSGTIRATLAATPRRAAVLAAKAAVLTVVVAAAGAVAVVGSLLALPSALAEGPTLRAAVGSVLYLVLIALLGLGVATVVRDSATSIAVVLGLLYLVPILASVIGDPHWQRVLLRIGPMSAGLSIQATTDLAGLPIGPWAGLSVTAAWATAALAVGGLLLRVRDA